MRRSIAIGVAASALLLYGAAPSGAQTGELGIKAEFIFRFASFVSWPESAFEQVQSPIVVGVLDIDLSFERILEGTLLGRKVRERPIEVTRLRRIGDTGGVHILVLGTRDISQAERQLDRLCGRPLLTVTDAPGLAKAGAIVNFFASGKKIRFEVNRRCEHAGGLAISSRMLDLAVILDDPQGGEVP